ncbi:export associated protein, partial [Streptomyces sp. WAC05292]
MTAELVRGQNHPLSRTRVEIGIAADTPVLALVAACDDTGRMAGPGALAHPGAPTVLPGLASPAEAAGVHRFAVDLEAVAASVHQLRVVLALPPGGPARFGSVAAPRVAVAEPGGADLAGFALAGLDAEGAVVALEVYRRQGAWKVRAVGQGYADGLPALLADAGLTAPAAAALASAALAAAAGPAGAGAAAARDGAGITAVPAAAAGTHGLPGPQETPPAGTAAGPAGAAPDAGGPATVPGPVPAPGTPYAGAPGPVPAADG